MPYTPEIQRTPNHALSRRGRFAVAELRVPHAVLSTCAVNGGIREDLALIANHQSCEGSGHAGRDDSLHRLPPANYHRQACAEAGLAPETTCLLGTAASMDYAALAEAGWEEVNVTAWVTGGVRGNAATAGDAAKWHEREGRWIPAQTEASPAPAAGTLNAIVLINLPVTHAALVRAAAMIAEAKAAALRELATPSLQGYWGATGTGTDQFAIAAPLATGSQSPLTWSGHHTKLGELLAQATLRAFRETLRWQNGLEPSLTRNLGWAGRPFGLDEAALRRELPPLLPPRSAELAGRNFEALLHHPRAASQFYAFQALEERGHYGTLPVSLLPELRLEQALLLAGYLASDSQGGHAPPPPAWREALAPLAHDVKALILRAMALGYAAKWA